jgi:branched-chain amino acid transport system ATP-binding protein
VFFEICNLTKRFGGVTAVDSVSISLNKGDIIGLIGPNGAGKTTVFNVINGIYKPDAGRVSLDGRDITGLPTFRIAGMGVARTFQNIRLFSNLTVFENVKTASFSFAGYSTLASIIDLPRARKEDAMLHTRCDELLNLVGLYEKRDELAKNLPYGHQRKLEIARALATNPSVLLLDEPAAGMNPPESKELTRFIDSIRERFSLTIILIEHHMDVVMRLCPYIYVLNFGKVIADGTPSEIQTNPEVITAYLGRRREVYALGAK